MPREVALALAAVVVKPSKLKTVIGSFRLVESVVSWELSVLAVALFSLQQYPACQERQQDATKRNATWPWLEPY